MVLHNSKWDRKAKKQYEKKHGIVSEHEKAKQEAIKNSVPDLPSNAWRFDEVKDEGAESSDDGIDYSKLKAKQTELPRGTLYERNILNGDNGGFSDSDNDEDDEEGTKKASRMLQEVSEAEKAKAKEMREKRAKANQLMNLKKKFMATEMDDEKVDDDDFFNEIDGMKNEEEKKEEKRKVGKLPTKGQQDFLDGLLG
ncbi:hypothetical protein CJU90_4016 [Yarrowia sp. C11]|nr:hypothetical protein CKK34_5627 [Yarrowia sp. E02]KAG5367710.1 hypothetical protein CJU90_4016 [Yarrowia sp. C11]